MSEAPFQIEVAEAGVEGPWGVVSVPGCGTRAFERLSDAIMATEDIAEIVSGDVIWRIRNINTGELFA